MMEMMKKAFQVLKDRPLISVMLTRDSVCAADDCAAPHEKTVKIHSFIDPEAFAREASSGYLPNVAGIGHSWICVLNDIKIAEIKTTEIQALVREATFDDKNRIHFAYKSATY
jgi:hypothetical protein